MVMESKSSSSQFKQPNTLQEAILLTLAYFDAQGMALTMFEIWQNLILWQTGFLELKKAIETDPIIKKRLTEKNGFYSIRGEEQIRTRFANQKISEMRYRKARSTAHWLSVVPFITSVSVVNTVALGNANRDSDIDLFITVKSGHIWLTRLLTTGVVQLLGRRKTDRRHANRVCLSFFAVDMALSFDQLSIPGGDPYLASWIQNIAPLYQSKKFNILGELNANNAWAAKIFPNYRMGELSKRRQVSKMVITITQPIKVLSEKIFGTKLGKKLEKKVQAKQVKRMGKVIPYRHHTRTSHVIISDEMLKFHEEDKRVWFRDKMLTTFTKLINGEELGDSNLQTEIPHVSSGGLFVQPVGETVEAEK